jgi:hypothetical protein
MSDISTRLTVCLEISSTGAAAAVLQQGILIQQHQYVINVFFSVSVANPSIYSRAVTQALVDSYEIQPLAATQAEIHGSSAKLVVRLGSA